LSPFIKIFGSNNNSYNKQLLDHHIFEMKKRYIYSFLFGAPGFFVSLILSFIIFGATTGFLWIYVFGDNHWPLSTEKGLPLLFVLTFLVLWIAFITVGFITGKNLEENSDFNKKHIMFSVGLTIAPIFLIVLHQLSVGNIGPKSDNMLCSDFCSQNGYSASGMPPKNSGERSCICFDDSGNEIMRVPIDSIVPSE
jgi:hypothetical protein